VLPSQINAIVSEMLSLAVCMDPTGAWNCTSVNNLCSAFTAYASNGTALATTLGFIDCNGLPIGSGAQLASCIDVQNAIAAIGVDRFLTAAAYNPATNLMTFTLSNGSTVVANLTNLITDVSNSLTPATIASSLAFVDANGAAISPGAALVTPANLAAAVLPANIISSLAFVDCDAAAIVAGAALVTCGELNTYLCDTFSTLPLADPNTTGFKILGIAGGASACAPVVYQAADYLTDLQGTTPTGQEPGPTKIVTVETLAPVVRFDDTNNVTGFGLGAAQDAAGLRITAVGLSAAKSATANGITAFGSQAAETSVGSNILAVGEQAARTNNAISLQAVGYFAGRVNTGATVMAYGFRAAEFNTGATLNAYGQDAGRNNTGIGSVQAFGLGAAGFNTGNSLNAYGYQAGQNNTGITIVNAYGYQAAKSNIGDGVHAYGTRAAEFNTGILKVHAYGYEAGATNSGETLMAYGYSAGRENTGALVSAYGYQAGRANTADYLNAFGGLAGYNNTGIFVSAYGLWAAKYNTGEDLQAYGAYAAQNNLGDYVSGYGHSAAEHNIGNDVEAFGRQAAKFNSGNNVNAFGRHAGRFNATSDNDFFGFNAGNGPFTTNESGRTITQVSPTVFNIAPATAAPISSLVAVFVNGIGTIADFTGGIFQVTSATQLTLISAPNTLAAVGGTMPVTLYRNAGFANNSYFGRGAIGTGPNQAVLGGPTQTPSGWSPFTNISDERDKLLRDDKQRPSASLDFVAGLLPIAFSYDHRERYSGLVEKVIEQETPDLSAEPVRTQREATKQELKLAKRARDLAIENGADPVEYDFEHKDDYLVLTYPMKTVAFTSEEFVVAEKDGSKADAFEHYGFFAQQIAAAATKAGIDPARAGVRDMNTEGGSDKLVLEPLALIAHMAGAIQALLTRIEALESR
jgi:hypothetical protein